MAIHKKKIKTSKGFQEHTYLGCSVTRNKTAWCYRICPPDENGIGRCGRIAPHSLKSAIQIGIEKHKELKVLELHLEKLSNWYLSQFKTMNEEIGVNIEKGQAEILIPHKLLNMDIHNSLDRSAAIRLVHDAGMLAVNSLTGHKLAVSEYVNFSFTKNEIKGDFVARGRFLHLSGELYMSEAVLSDSNMNEFCRAEGAFSVSNMVLNEDGGYVCES